MPAEASAEGGGVGVEVAGDLAEWVAVRVGGGDGDEIS